MSLFLGRLAVSSLLLTGASLTALGFTAVDSMTMPGKSFTGVRSILTTRENEVAARMKQHVGMLAGTIGERNMTKPEKLAEAANYIEEQWTKLGYKVKSQEFLARGKTVRNLEVEITGQVEPKEILVIGAHYDSVPNCPGANDNASGIAGVLELSRLLKGQNCGRTVRFVAFTNEEDPYFDTPDMGSYRYAKRCRDRGESIAAMVAVETIGYHSDRANTQKLPPLCDLIYPRVGNFVWFVGNQKSKDLVKTCVKTFREKTPFPSQGAAAPEWIEGVDWCDQLYFWKYGYPGLMVTDSAPYRYPYYHQPDDTPDKIDYQSTGRIINGLGKVVEHLASRTVNSHS